MNLFSLSSVSKIGQRHGNLMPREIIFFFCLQIIDAPWCTHCKSFSPIYAQLANKLEEISSNVKVVKVDATKDEKYTNKYDVKGYPTLKLFRSGEWTDFWGVKTVERIMKWLEKKTGPRALEIKSVKEAEAFISSQPVVVIGFFDDFDSDDVEIFLGAADTIDNYDFGITSNKDVFKKYEAESGSVILFKEFDERKSVFDGPEITERAIQKFVAVYAPQVIIDFNRNVTHHIFSVVQTHLLMLISKKEGHMEKYVEPARDVAGLFRGKVAFVAIDVDEDAHKQILDYFRLDKGGAPTIRLLQFTDNVNRKFKPKDADLSPESIKTFVQDGIDGKLKTDLLSQDLPEDWDKTPVKTLVSNNFEDVAFDESKDVFVSFYSPW